MANTQRRVLFILSLIGLVYFLVFLVPNSYGARTEEILLESSADEHVTYPNVLRILTVGETFNDTRANLFLYEDYHYGYPFYAFSALTLLPVRLLEGEQFADNMQRNLLVLRQFISLLPMVLAAGILVYLQTRFQSLWKSVALFVLLLSVRGVVRNHMWWWHPDALAVLFVVLTIFFLDRDRLRFGRNFLLAAAACGLATAIKLTGVFFFLAVPAYLLAGLLAKKVSLPRAALAAALFVLVMGAVTVFSNPFLFSDDQRARMLEIQAQKQEELSKGYQHDDPIYYSKGPRWWASTLEKWYGHPLFLAFLFGSLAAGCLWGREKLLHRLILAWVVPYSIYLLYFVAVKPDHYWLPVMLPLFSCAFTLPVLLAGEGAAPLRARFAALPGWRRAALAAIVLLLAGHFVVNLTRDVSGNIPLYRSHVETGIRQIERLNP